MAPIPVVGISATATLPTPYYRLNLGRLGSLTNPANTANHAIYVISAMCV